MAVLCPFPSPDKRARGIALWGLAVAAALVASAGLFAAGNGQPVSLRTASGQAGSDAEPLLLEEPGLLRPASEVATVAGDTAVRPGRSLNSPPKRPHAPRWANGDPTRVLQNGEETGMAEGRVASEEEDRRERALAPAIAFEVGYGGATDDDSAVFPPLEESTLMFMHVFKCAGSTLRHMLIDWAEESGDRGAIVRQCDQLQQEGLICLRHYELIDEVAQTEQISRLKVLAGHFMWGFQRHVQTPHLMITALRNPLEVFVSGYQYQYRKETSTLRKARKFVSAVMDKTLSTVGPAGLDKASGQVGGYIRRFVGVDRGKLFENGLEAAADEAIRNLETFWIVGVVEQYPGFEKVLQRSLDAEGKHTQLWNLYAKRQYNSSPVETREVLAEIDPKLVQRFNESLALQWKVYDKAVSLWDIRCRGVLPEKVHQAMCVVPPPIQSYR